MEISTSMEKNIEILCNYIKFNIDIFAKAFDTNSSNVFNHVFNNSVFHSYKSSKVVEIVDNKEKNTKTMKKSPKKSKKEKEEVVEKEEVGRCDYVFSKGTRQGYMCDKETEKGETYCASHKPEDGKPHKKHIRTIINREIWYKVHPPTGFVVDDENPIGAIGIANKPGIDTTGRSLTKRGFYTLNDTDKKTCKRWGFVFRQDWEAVDPVINDEKDTEKDDEEEVVETPPKRIEVYTDGACPNNGKPGAMGGVGVWFGEGDKRNVSEALPGERQTNQRAEIYACIRALEVLEGTQGVVEVFTDSMYVVNAMTQWIAGWMLKKWKGVENVDLFERLHKLACKRTIVWTHVKGHAGIKGNEMADRLAVEGVAKHASSSSSSSSSIDEKEPKEAFEKVNNMDHDRSTVTLTFGDCAENHKGMQIIGGMVPEGSGFNLKDMEKIQKNFQTMGCETKMYALHELGGVPKTPETEAYVLHIKKAIPAMLKGGEFKYSDMWNEQVNIELDKKAFMYGRVVDKHARWNVCFGEESQEPDYERKKGRIVAMDDVPVLKSVVDKFEGVFGPKSVDMKGEGNYYYDVKDCGIGFHGDSERRKVIAFRIGASIPIHYQWFHEGVAVGNRMIIPLDGGDAYVMSEKAVGTDWKKKKIYTLRHATGCAKFTTIKDDSASVDSNSVEDTKPSKKSDKKEEKEEKKDLKDLKDKLKSINKGSPVKDSKVRMSTSLVKKGKASVDTYYYKSEDETIVVSSTNKDEDLEFISDHFKGKKFELSDKPMNPTHRVALPDARRKTKGIVKITVRQPKDDSDEE
jgi:ribonuclease HI